MIVGLISSIAILTFSAAEDSNDIGAARSYLLTVVNAQVSAAPVNNGFTTDSRSIGVRNANVSIETGIADRLGEVSMAIGIDGSMAVSAWAQDGLCVGPSCLTRVTLDTQLRKVADSLVMLPLF